MFLALTTPVLALGLLWAMQVLEEQMLDDV